MDRMTAYLNNLSTEMLIEVARKVNLGTTAEEIMVSARVSTVLESRLPEAEFLALMNELEAELMAV